MDAMLDLETLGTSSQPALLQMALVMFDPNENELNASFNMHIDPQSCINVGANVQWDTIKWWLGQSEEARGRVIKATDRTPIGGVMLQAYEFLKTNKVNRIWSHGATFDIPIVSAYARRLQMQDPWKFWSARDTRTLFDLYGSDPSKTAVVEGPSHDALVDAKKQAIGVQIAWKAVKMNALGNKFPSPSQTP
jgi:hypothetical protein